MKKNKSFKNVVLFLMITVMTALVPLTAISAEAVDAVGITVNGGTSEPSAESMETAILAAKQILSIDDTVFSDFYYSSGYSNYQTMEGLIWYFTWYDSNSGENINATITADGVLLSFYKYNRNSWSDSFGLAKVKKSDAVIIANEFVKKATPETFSYYESSVDASAYLHSRDYNIYYTANINGYAFNSSNISVQVDKFTGEVMSYNASSMNPANYKHESPSNIITSSAAIKAYADKIGLSLEYSNYYDWDSKTMKVYPVYRFNSSSDRYISATSGDIVTYVYDRGSDAVNTSDDAASPEMAASSSASGGGLSPAEKAALEQLKGFITAEQALENLLEAADLKNLDTSYFNNRNINLDKNYYNEEEYFYNIYMYSYNGELKENEIQNLSGKVDAATGRVLAFSYSQYEPYLYNYYTDKIQTPPAYSLEQAEKIVEEFLSKMAPGEWSKTQGGMKPLYDIYNTFYYFSYIRVENDILFRSNSIDLQFNPRTGKITSYSLNWYNNIEFPSVANVLTPEQALTSYVKQNGYKINYITAGNSELKLVYNFNSSSNYIDPFTGKALNYNGELRTDDDFSKPDYSDLKGHWSENVVNELYENGVYLWNGNFQPDKEMTQFEFYQYISLIDRGYAVPLTEFVEQNFIKEDDAYKIVTKQEAAKIVAEYLGYGKLASQPEMFVYPFKDNVSSDYKGYITICYMLGIIQGDGSNNFNALSSITRAQAAVILYNMILDKAA